MIKSKQYKYRENISVQHQISLEDILDEMRHMPRDDAFNFIKQLDHGFEDWEFTCRLIDYFKAMEKIYEEESRKSDRVTELISLIDKIAIEPVED